MVNDATISGESVSGDKSPGPRAFAGAIVESGALDIHAESVDGDRSVGRIVALVEGAALEQAPVRRMADPVAGWLMPLVVVLLVALFWITHDARTIVPAGSSRRPPSWSSQPRSL